MLVAFLLWLPLTPSPLHRNAGMLLHSLPTNFTLKGEFDVRGMDMSVLSTEFSHSEIFAQLTGYSTQQLEMFVLLQRAMERCVTDCETVWQWWR